RQAFGHALEQTMAAVRRQYDGLAALGDPHSRFPLERDMTDHLALAISRYGRNELAALDLAPITARREHLRVHVAVAIDGEKAAGDRRRIAFLRQVDDVVAGGCGDGRRGWRPFVSGRGLRVASQAAVNADFPSVD